MSAITWSIRRPSTFDEILLEQLADVLVDCVEGGASVSFMYPLPRERALTFWHRVAQRVTAGECSLLIAEDAQGACGTVLLVLDQPENQPHRADLQKLLVHRRARRQGLATMLMRAAEDTARDFRKTLLVLDTVTGGDGERLYRGLGWHQVGMIPGYSLMPRGGLCSTTVFYRDVEASIRLTARDRHV
jgi:GNAT superfamily N-acetyltransferase